MQWKKEQRSLLVNLFWKDYLMNWWMCDFVEMNWYYMKKAVHLCRGCNLVLMGGWYLRMAEAVEACMSSSTQPEHPHRPYWQLQWVGRIHPELCGLMQPKMQLKAIPNIQPQGRGFESRLCHIELTSGKIGVGQHWWGTCPGYMPKWLCETYCEQGRPMEYKQPLPRCEKK